MSDIKLFKVINNKVNELTGSFTTLEKSLQTLIENHLESFLGISFLASEYSTGKVHGGRIDTLGIDENGCPVIIEYKKASNENVINQGLFYLDWLMDHKAEFKLLVLEKFNKKASENIEWGSPRLLCIAGDFSKYDEHAVQQMNRNIELIRYRRYGNDLLLFELVNATTSYDDGKGTEETVKYTTVSESLAKADKDLQDRFETLKKFLLALGDDVQMRTLKLYFAFKRIKNFACIEIRPQKKGIIIFLKVNPENIDLKEGFSRDVRKIGHFGTGDLEITIRNDEDLENAEPLLIKSYEIS